MQSFPKPLSAKEEKECIARKYNMGDRDMDDLISIGTIGLIKGIDSFDENKNIRLATYAARCIEKALSTRWQHVWGSEVSK